MINVGLFYYVLIVAFVTAVYEESEKEILRIEWISYRACAFSQLPLLAFQIEVDHIVIV